MLKLCGAHTINICVCNDSISSANNQFALRQCIFVKVCHFSPPIAWSPLRKLFTSVFLTPSDDEKKKRNISLLSKEAVSCHIISRSCFFFSLTEPSLSHFLLWAQSWTMAESTHNRVEQKYFCWQKGQNRITIHAWMLHFQCFHSLIGVMIYDWGDCYLKL